MVALGVLSLVCGFCKVQAAQRILKRVTKFTLFFIPLFPVSTRHFVTCVNCGGTTEIAKQQVDQYLESSRTSASSANSTRGSAQTDPAFEVSPL